jgi:hypothetical protein
MDHAPCDASEMLAKVATGWYQIVRGHVVGEYVLHGRNENG